MVNFEKIVYREEDNCLVIVSLDNEIVKVLFLDKIKEEYNNSLLNLKNLCQSKIEDLIKYVVAYKGTNIINIEFNGGVYEMKIEELTNEEKTIVNDSINICINLLNE